MAKVTINESTLTDIADAIRAKTGDSALIDPADMADEIESIPTGGSDPEVSKKDVVFIDDMAQKVVYSYTAEEFLALTEMPPNPDHTAEGMISQGWNWTLADAQEQLQESEYIAIGQNYITYSGNTEYDIEIDGVKKFGFRLQRQSSASVGDINIDWGDGSTDSVFPNYGTYSEIEHNYTNNGIYTISISAPYPTLHLAHSQDQIKNNLIAVKFGNNALFGGDAFIKCRHLCKVTIPKSMPFDRQTLFTDCSLINMISLSNESTCFLNSAFRNTMRFISVPKNLDVSRIQVGIPYVENFCIPKTATSLASGYLREMRYLRKIVIPSGITNLPNNLFYDDVGITKISFKGDINSVAASAFYNVKAIISFANCTTVPTLANTNAFTISNYLRIEVPSALKSEWKAATNWATYADYIVGV